MKASQFKNFKNGIPYRFQDSEEACAITRYMVVFRDYYMYISFVGEEPLSIMDGGNELENFKASKFIPEYLGDSEFLGIEKITKEEFSDMVEKAMAYQRAKLNKYLAL